MKRFIAIAACVSMLWLFSASQAQATPLLDILGFDGNGVSVGGDTAPATDVRININQRVVVFFTRRGVLLNQLSQATSIQERIQLRINFLRDTINSPTF